MNTIFFGSFFINNFGNFASKNEISRSVYLTLCHLTGYTLCTVVIPYTFVRWLYLIVTGGYTTKINT